MSGIYAHIQEHIIPKKIQIISGATFMYLKTNGTKKRRQGSYRILFHKNVISQN